MGSADVAAFILFSASDPCFQHIKAVNTGSLIQAIAHDTYKSSEKEMVLAQPSLSRLGLPGHRFALDWLGAVVLGAQHLEQHARTRHPKRF